MTRLMAVVYVVACVGCGVQPEPEQVQDDNGGGAGGEAEGGVGGEPAGGSHEGGAGGVVSQLLDASAPKDPSSLDAGSSDAVSMMATSDLPPPGWVPAIVAVGYAGIRALSKDLGKSWPVHPALEGGPGNDDGDLLRGVAYGKGLWLTGGWQHLVSKDGVNWTKSPLPKGCGLLEGIAYGNGRFIATCGEGDTFISEDGRTWRNGKGAPTGHHTNVVFGVSDGNALFAVSGDTGATFTSPDGMQWTNVPGVTHGRYCRGSLQSGSNCPGVYGHDVWVRAANGPSIERSVDGKSWSKAASFPSYVSWFAFGYAPP